MKLCEDALEKFSIISGSFVEKNVDNFSRLLLKKMTINLKTFIEIFIIFEKLPQFVDHNCSGGTIGRTDSPLAGI